MKKKTTNAILEYIEKKNNESFRIKEDVLPYINTPLHYHPYYELVWIKKGYGIRIVGDNIDQFKENDMALLGPNLPHVWENDPLFYENDPELKVDVYVLHFSEKLLYNLIQILPELSDISTILEQSCRGIHIKNQTNKKISQLLIQLLRASSIERILLFLQLFQLFLSNPEVTLLSSAEFSEFFSSKNSERLRKVYEYIGKNFQRNIQIEEIANIACISPTAFCRYFKQETGHSFIYFLNNFRLGYAQNLLNSSEYKMVDIAQMCGFQDVSYFNRIFKKKNGMTPSDYKQQMNKR